MTLCFQEGVISRIQKELKNAQTALYETVEEIATVFAGMDDAYMKERAADVKDVGKRLMARIKGDEASGFGEYGQ